MKEKSLAPDTTAQQDLTTLGQRRVNLIWEYTQAFLAIFVTVTVIGLGIYLAIIGNIDDFPPFLTLAFGLIIGFYFSRTNHQSIGGIGPKPRQEYKGR